MVSRLDMIGCCHTACVNDACHALVSHTSYTIPKLQVAQWWTGMLVVQLRRADGNQSSDATPTRGWLLLPRLATQVCQERTHVDACDHRFVV